MITGKTVSMFQISQKSKGPKELCIKFGYFFGINFVLIKFCDSDILYVLVLRILERIYSFFTTVQAIK